MAGALFGKSNTRAAANGSSVPHSLSSRNQLLFCGLRLGYHAAAGLPGRLKSKREEELPRFALDDGCLLVSISSPTLS